MLKFFKKKKKVDHSSSDRYFKLQIKEVIKETEDARTLVFEQPEKPLVYTPGQFLTLILPIDNKEVRRSYSLCTSPYSNENPAITVKRVETGTVSNYLNDHMKVGDSFEVMEPAGHFTPELDAKNEKKYILFAAGSGITPIMSILKSILTEEPNSSVSLVYQNRTWNSIIYRDMINDLTTTFRGRLEVVHVLSKPSSDWTGYSGRLNAAITNDVLLDIASNHVAEAEYFLCGPSGFMQTIIDVLADFQVEESGIHKESFFTGQSNTKTKTEPASNGHSTVVKILLDQEEFEVNVPENKSILEAALDQDVDMPFSCQSGLCTACRGKLLKGEVAMEEDEGLTEEEINEGYILNCVSKPKGPGVIVEVG